MKEQKNQYLQGDTLLQTHTIGESNQSKQDFVTIFQIGISKIEIHSSLFYIMQKIEMFLITLVSSSALFRDIKKENSLVSIFNNISAKCFFSPQIYQNSSMSSIIVISCILFSLFSMIGFTLFIGNKIKGHYPINDNIVKLWIIFTHLLLPIPSFIIGYHFGYYFYELTHYVHECQLILITFTAVIWVWTLVTCNSIYNSNSFKRKSDMCRIHHTFISLHNVILIFPMVQGMMPYLIKSFFPSCDFYIYTFIEFFISLFMSIFISINKPYEQSSMNKFATFLFVIRIPLSFIPIIEKHFSAQFEPYLIFITVFIFVTFLITINPFTCSYPIPEKSRISENAESNDDNIFDPTINLPFPFNRASFTKQDIFLYIFVFCIVIFMNILNAIAAQRVPATAPLLDFMHNRFMVSKCIRTNITKAISQISNDFILFQIGLLFFILFVFPQHFDFRRAVFIYGCICFIRAISFCITSLPVPCAGEPNCPCADRANINALKSGSPIRIAMSWLFGLGMFLKYPQCGDLIISGHTICIWLFTRTCATALNSALQRPFNWFVSGFLYTFSFFTMMYIILSKNHYSIDVWFGFILTELFWQIYNAILKLSMLPRKPNDSFYVNLIRWIENRPKRRALVVNQKLKEDIMKN